MLTYKVRLFENPEHENLNWGWQVYAWHPQRYLIAEGLEKTKDQAVDTALTMLDHSEHEEWKAVGDLHLSRR